MVFRTWFVTSLLFSALPACANMIITPTFDFSITNNPNAALIESAINNAISRYDQLFANNVNVQIYFQAFTGGGGLGQSDINGSLYGAGYQGFYNALVAEDANPMAIATLSVDGSGTTDPVLHNTFLGIKSANARALGGVGFNPGCVVTPGDTSPATNAPNHCATTGTGQKVDGIITLNLNFTSPPQIPTGGTYSLTAVAEHEIDEVLGLGSALPGTKTTGGTVTNSFILPEDLWRYTSSGQRVFAVNNCPGTSNNTAFFSITGTGSGVAFNNACNGGDFGDWQGGATHQVQDAFATPGAPLTLGTNEISALTAIGYSLATPEPGTIGLLLSSLGVLALVRRRR